MDPSYGERYRTLFERHWWWRARERVVVRELEALRPADGWRRALDVGCGDGLFLDTLGLYADTVEGVEPDERIVSERTRASGRVHVQPFDEAYSPGAIYDLMVFLDVLEHISDAERAVAHAASLMEPGGTLLVTVPAFMHLWTTHDEINLHVTRFTRRRLIDLLSTAFEVRKARYFFRWVHGAKLVQRAIEAVRRPEPAPPEMPPTPFNGAMYFVSRAEEALLGSLPLPVGSSLLAVAHKT